MPNFPEQDWNGPVLKVELTPEEVDVLADLLERLDKLVQIEAIFDDVAWRSASILGTDMPHVTQEGRDLIATIIRPWMPGDAKPWEEAYDETPDERAARQKERADEARPSVYYDPRSG